jgi:hypothetical protein
MRYVLLILFLWYYVSITLFTHTHTVNGVLIVHSHLYNPFSGNKPVNHQHSANGFVLIQLLSHFLTTVTFFGFLFEVYQTDLRKYILKKNDGNFSGLFFLCSNGLRAPPLNFHN